MTAGDLAIHTRELTRRFGSFVAVDGVNLEVPRNCVFGLIGPNGAGKTTLIRMLLGLLTPTAGRGTVLGHDIASEAEVIRQKAGYLSQRFSLYNDLTVQENLTFYGRVYGLRNPELARRRHELLEWLGLAEYRLALAGELGRGERQRLAFACAVIHRPSLLLLDEPTSGVDPGSRRRFWDLIYDLADGGTTVLVTTHYMDEADYCDRLGMMLGGRLVCQGTPDYIRREFAGGAGLDAAFTALAAALPPTTCGG